MHQLDNLKDSFYKEVVHELNQFLKYQTKIFLCYLNAKVERDDIFKWTIGWQFHKISNDKEVKSSKLCHNKKPNC